MKLIKMKGPKCMLASAAMLFDCSIEEVEAFIGHDGLTVLEGRYKGIHIQEIQKFALCKGYALALYEPTPMLDTGPVECWEFPEYLKWLKPGDR